MRTVLVTGATGNVGRTVVTALRDRGASVRAFVRDAERARRVLGDEVGLAVGDFGDPAALREGIAALGEQVSALASAHLRPSGRFALHDALSDEALVRQAWKDTAAWMANAFDAFAPELTPTNKPSSRASRRVIACASSVSTSRF